MDDEEEFVAEVEDDALPNASHADDRASDDRIDRRGDRAQDERVRQSDALERLADDESFERFEVDDDIWQLGHNYRRRVF